MTPRPWLPIVLALLSLSLVAAVVPGPPQNLDATVNGNTVTLTWEPPLTDGVLTGYVVQAALSPGGAATVSLPVEDTTLTVTAVPNGVYYARVISIFADGESTPSNEVIVIVPGGGGGCTSPPNAPTNLTSTVAGNFVALAWAAPANGCAATAYVVQAGAASGSSDLAVLNVGGATTISVAAPPGTYYVRVVALNPFGGSTASNEIVVSVAAPCQPPTNSPELVTAQQSGSDVNISWFTPGGSVTGYIVEAGSSPGANNLLNAMTVGTGYVWANAPAGTAYIRVRAMNSCGTGPPSPDVSLTIAGRNPEPSCGPTKAPCGLATALCNDGTYSCSQTRSGACSANRGVACWICPGPLCEAQ